jgi:hypothetical protein
VDGVAAIGQVPRQLEGREEVSFFEVEQECDPGHLRRLYNDRQEELS